MRLRTDSERAHRSANRWTLASRIVGGLVIVGIIVLSISAGYAQHDTILAQRTQLEETENRAEAAEARERALYEQLLAAGEDPVVTPAPTSTRGETGATGPQGRPPTASEVLDAIETYCSYRGDCRGETGAQGQPGTSGTNGVSGADGQNGADGAPGADGAQGPAGSDGRGIASVSCEFEGLATVFRFTYTDGTTQDVPGSCLPG